MSLISPNFDVKSIFFSQFWPGAFSRKCWKRPCPANYPHYNPVIPVGVGEQRLQMTGALAISADPDEMLRCEMFHLALVCFSKYLNQPVYRFLV